MSLVRLLRAGLPVAMLSGSAGVTRPDPPSTACTVGQPTSTRGLLRVLRARRLQRRRGLTSPGFGAPPDSKHGSNHPWVGPPNGCTRRTKEVRLSDLQLSESTLTLTHRHATASCEGSGRSSLGRPQELSSVQVGPLTATDALSRDSAEGSSQREGGAPTLGSYVSHLKEQSKTW